MRRTPVCPKCGNYFSSKGKFHGNKHLPVLLLCGHAVCSCCVKQLASSQTSTVTCPVCKLATALKENGPENLITDAYVLGLCELNKQAIMNRMKSKVQYQQSGSSEVNSFIKKSRHNIVCAKCQSSATCKCDKCEIVLCSACFDKIHEASNMLMSHQASPLQAIMVNAPAVCLKHDSQLMEFFCEEDNEMVCSHCAILGDHEGHQVTLLSETNKRAVREMKPALDQAVTVLEYMRDSDKVLSSVAQLMQTDHQSIINKITDQFKQLHGLLQVRETALIEEIINKRNIHERDIGKLKADLENNMMYLDRTIRVAQDMISDDQKANMLPGAKHVLDTLNGATSLPCYTVNVDVEVTSKLRCSFPCDLAEAIGSYGKLEGVSQIPIKLKPLSEIQERDLQKIIPERVSVMHIKNPHHFIVQRSSDLERIKQLEKKINRHCMDQKATSSVPRKAAVGDHVLSNYMGTWYRAKISKVLTDDTVTDPSKIQLEIIYIDYGNTDHLTLDMLRAMKPEFMKLPETTQLCSLVDIVPADESGEWSLEALHAFALMTADKTLNMVVKHKEDNVFFVDLTKPRCDDIKDDLPVSVRDALVFLEHACFISPSSVPDSLGVMPKPKTQYQQPSLPTVGSIIPCVVSHAESPSKFFIQQLGNNTNAMYEMMTKLQSIYTQDTKDLYTVFCPQKYMVCAALYEQDKVWYRAEVVELPSRHNVKVRYVDYGNEERISQWNLRELQDEFLSLPIQAIECQLTDVAPLDEEKGWTTEAVKMFADTVASKKMEIVVKNTINDKILDVVLRELPDFDSAAASELICFNSWLIDQGLALSTVPCSNSFAGLSLEETCLAMNPEMVGLTLLTDNTTDAVAEEPVPDKPLGIKVRVSHMVNPGELYLQLVSDDEDRLRIMSELMRHYTGNSPVAKSDVKSGDACAVLCPEDKQWYRGEILSLEGDQAKVQLIDYGSVIILPRTDVYLLPVEFSDQDRYAVLCHLKDLQPAGDSSHWTKTSAEFLSDLLTEAVCYTDDQSAYDGKSMGVDLIKVEVIKGGALSCDQMSYKSIRELLLDKGLALPKSTTKIKQASSTSQPLPVRAESSAKSAVTGTKPIHTEISTELMMTEESQTETSSDLCTETGRVSISHVSHSSSDDEMIDSTSVECEQLKLPEVSSCDVSSPQPIPEPVEHLVLLPLTAQHDYKLPKVPTDSCLTVVPTYIDYDCHIYVQSIKPDDHPEGRLGVMMRECTVEVQLQNAYFERMKLCRAKIIRDGNCLFRAFALALFSDQDKHDEVRKTVVNTLHQYWWLFENVLAGVKKNDYLETMSKGGTYGGEPEILAACLAYKARVDVYMGGLSTPIICRTYGSHNDALIRLSYMCDGQYDCGHHDLVVENTDLANRAEVVYNNWRALKVEDYQMSNRQLSSNHYDNSILQQIMDYLQSKYSDSPPEPASQWHVDQAVVAQYSDDQLFYRAIIVNTQDSLYRVKYVDFGNEELVPATALRSGIALADIPIQCYECVLENIEPVSEDGRWSASVLNKIHAMLVGKTFDMYIKDVFEECKLVIDLEDSQNNSIASRLCTLGLATLDMKAFDVEVDADEDSALIISKTVEVDKTDLTMTPDQLICDIPKRSVKSPFPNHIELKENDVISCFVTQVDSPNEIYLQRISQLEASAEIEMEIKKQLDRLVEIQGILNTKYTDYKKIPEPKPGLACCAKYHADQCWYRGEILSVGQGPNRDLYGILLVDYGSPEFAEGESLLELPTELVSFPVQAVKCRLSGVCSPPGGGGDDNGLACHKATKALTELLVTEPLVAAIKQCSSDQYVVDLYDKDEYSASGKKAPLIYDNLIKSRTLLRCSGEESEVITKEIFEEVPGASDNDDKAN